MHSITELPAWERLFKKIVWEQFGNLEGKKILLHQSLVQLGIMRMMIL